MSADNLYKYVRACNRMMKKHGCGRKSVSAAFFAEVMRAARSAKGRVLALTDTGYLRYNVKLQGLYPKGGFFHAENLPAQEAPQKKGAWFQKENVR